MTGGDWNDDISWQRMDNGATNDDAEPQPEPLSAADSGPPDDPAAGAALGGPSAAIAVEGGPRRVNRRFIVVAIGVILAGLIGVFALTSSGDSDRIETTESASSSAASKTSTSPATISSTSEPDDEILTQVAQPSTSSSTSTVPAPTSPPVETAPPLDDEPAVVARPVPVEPPPPPPEAPPPPWAGSVFTTAGGHVSTDVGCAADLSAASLDAFFAARIGPVLGWDYQHVYPLGGNRYLWLFQDTFIDQSGTANTLDKATFVHNSAMVQDGRCFRVLHGGSTVRPAPFEPGTGTATLRTWFWPMGGEVHNGRLYVFWAEMLKDGVDPKPPDGLGWHPVATHIATYDPTTLARLDFRRAPNSGASPIYGYAVQSDDRFTYLFANTFEQNLTREGGWASGPHSGSKMFLARVPKGQFFDAPQYWTSKGWIDDVVIPEPFLQRHWSEFPMQPRLIDGQWVAVNAVNGYWGEEFQVDVANKPWGPWTTVAWSALVPRSADPKKNTYHAHLLPWRDGFGQLVVSVSNNARDMLRDAWPNPERYRPVIFTSPWQVAPPPATTTTSTTTTSTTTTSTTSTTTTSTTSTTTTTTTTTTVPGPPSTPAQAPTTVASTTTTSSTAVGAPAT